ncbi:MAG TPA: ribosome maturation factor RimP [Acidimicrobiales bacterium]|nr:ribosome maturation factor RimP [Acidimicrobiales bacterium]
MEDELLTALQPVVEPLGLELVDVERRGAVLLVTVDRPGGVDLDALTTANRAVSRALDDLDPIPGRYSLEVSSPGLERRLRTPAHFTRAIGETVTVKTRPQVPGERRRRGRLVSADEEGFELLTSEGGRGAGGEGGAPDGADRADACEQAERVRFSYSEVDRVRTVFEWGPASAGARRATAAPAAARAARARPGGRHGHKKVVNR